MTQALDQLHPAGRTDRRTYGVSVLSGAAALVTFSLIVSSAGLPSWMIAAAGAVVFVVLALLTIRRLRDAGLSSWLALLLVFPFGISIDAATVTVSGFAFQLFDLGTVIRSVPILLGLALPSGQGARQML